MKGKGIFTAALELACRCHRDQYDRQGKPYILHVLRVAHGLNTTDEELMAIAVLHDVKEDHGVTDDQLRAIGMTPRIIEGVNGLTHLPGDSYEVYTEKMRGKMDCLRTKRSDIRDNSDITRLSNMVITDKDTARFTKYGKAFKRVEEMIFELEQLGPEGVRWQMLGEEELRQKNLDRGREALLEMSGEREDI